MQTQFTHIYNQEILLPYSRINYRFQKTSVGGLGEGLKLFKGDSNPNDKYVLSDRAL